MCSTLNVPYALVFWKQMNSKLHNHLKLCAVGLWLSPEIYSNLSGNFYFIYLRYIQVLRKHKNYNNNNKFSLEAIEWSLSSF